TASVASSRTPRATRTTAPGIPRPTSKVNKLPLARRSIAQAVSFADWAGVPLEVARSGGFLIARTAQHRDYLARELAQPGGGGADVREAARALVAGRLSYYRAAGEEFALWCPEDVYIAEPASLIRAYLAACRRHGVVVAEHEPVVGIPVAGGRVAGVETAGRAIAAPVVVDAAGGGGRGGGGRRQVADLAGAAVPLAPVRHQLFITEPVPGIDPADPIVRVVDAAVYLRPARGGLMFGGFEAGPLPVDPRQQPPAFTTDDVP